MPVMADKRRVAFMVLDKVGNRICDEDKYEDVVRRCWVTSSV